MLQKAKIRNGVSFSAQSGDALILSDLVKPVAMILAVPSAVAEDNEERSDTEDESSSTSSASTPSSTGPASSTMPRAGANGSTRSRLVPYDGQVLFVRQEGHDPDAILDDPRVHTALGWVKKTDKEILDEAIHEALSEDESEETPEDT